MIWKRRKVSGRVKSKKKKKWITEVKTDNKQTKNKNQIIKKKKLDAVNDRNIWLVFSNIMGHDWWQYKFTNNKMTVGWYSMVNQP